MVDKKIKLEVIKIFEVNINISSCKNHVKALCKYFNDPNYYKIEGKPCWFWWRSSNEYITLLNRKK